MAVLLPITHYLDYCSFIGLEVRQYKSFKLVLSQFVLGNIGPIILLDHLKIIIAYCTLLGGTAGAGKEYSL